MVEVTASVGATELDVDGCVDGATGIRYIGKARKTFDGCWRCLADVGGSLCLVELRVSPTIHINADPGDEDDHTPEYVP